MNFISTFEELNKLYEEAPKAEREDDNSTEAVEEACVKEELTEAAEDEEIEIVDDEQSIDDAPIEELAESEPVQFVLECSKCGALIVKSEEDVTEVDEDTNLVNVGDECKFCEEAEGYKIIGTLVPYEVTEAEDIDAVDDEAVEDDIIEEDLADVARKVLDKPASTKTQQAWEDELNGEMGEISDKRRAHLEKKFAQQRDWEACHENDEELEELLDIKPDVSLNLDGGTGNNVKVL